MLEQMLAQFSYANFAYVVMSEMEPYLSELFVELQTLQKEAANEDELDQTGNVCFCVYFLYTFLYILYISFGLLLLGAHYVGILGAFWPAQKVNMMYLSLE